MRLFNILAFDEVITGTSKTWYSPSELNEALGQAETLAIHAFTTTVSGTSPTVTLRVEHSADGQDWSASAVGSATAITEQGSIFLPFAGYQTRYARLGAALAGTSPQCRLRLYVTGRAAVGAPVEMTRAGV